MSEWITQQAQDIAARFAGELQALVDVSSPSGDREGAERCAELAIGLAPAPVRVERLPCASDGFADDLLLTITGSGTRKVLLVGHLDTVIGHANHEPFAHVGDRYLGSGSVDMKGGDVIALGVLRALAQRPQDIAEAALLLVTDEEWRVNPFAHAARFAGYDACLTFEAGERDADGNEGVVVKRKAAGAIKVVAHGRSAHAGSKFADGRNALLALATATQALAACHDPDGPDHRSAVPTMLRTGDALNVIPDSGELVCDVRADSLDAIDAAMAAVPREVDGVTLEVSNLRRWPGMDAREAAAPVLARAGEILGAPIVACARGGASDASHFAATIGVSIDGLGPLGGDAHAPGEWVDAVSVERRAAVALAVADAVLMT